MVSVSNNVCRGDSKLGPWEVGGTTNSLVPLYSYKCLPSLFLICLSSLQKLGTSSSFLTWPSLSYLHKQYGGNFLWPPPPIMPYPYLLRQHSLAVRSLQILSQMTPSSVTYISSMTLHKCLSLFLSNFLCLGITAFLSGLKELMYRKHSKNSSKHGKHSGSKWILQLLLLLTSHGLLFGSLNLNLFSFSGAASLSHLSIFYSYA